MRLRFPMKLQIAILMFFFIVVVGVVAFRSTTQFLEEDKISTVRELHSLQVSQAVVTLQENIGLARGDLQAAAQVLVNGDPADIKLNPQYWEWARVQGKSWINPEWKETLPPETAPKNEKWSLKKIGSTHIYFAEPIRIRQGQTLQNFFVEGVVKASVIFKGLASSEDRGMKLAIMDFSDLKASQGIRVDSQTLFASPKALADMKRIFASPSTGKCFETTGSFPDTS